MKPNARNVFKDKAKWVRQQVFEMIVSAGKGHIGGTLSCVEILVALYYGGAFRFGVAGHDSDERDRFILSKGHAAAALYAILADMGYFTVFELSRFNKSGSILSGHPDRRIPGIEADSGSLGHGLGIGIGLALGAKLDRKNFKTVVLVGDGECAEGAMWESAAFAAHHKLSNVMGIVDNNGVCSTDLIKNCLDIEPIEDRWKAFGWEVVTVNGHSFDELERAFEQFIRRDSDKPMMVIAKTIKGKGISFMEGDPRWHHEVPRDAELETARGELAS